MNRFVVRRQSPGFTSPARPIVDPGLGFERQPDRLQVSSRCFERHHSFVFPTIPGYDVAGIVVDTDSGSEFVESDRVMAFLDHARGGALADYAVCAVASAAKIPDSMPMEEAAAIPLAGTTALQSLRNHGKNKSGQSVLIKGASGGVEAFAVQIAKSYGCHVDAFASARNRDFYLSLGGW